MAGVTRTAHPRSALKAKATELGPNPRHWPTYPGCNGVTPAARRFLPVAGADTPAQQLSWSAFRSVMSSYAPNDGLGAVLTDNLSRVGLRSAWS